MDKVEGPRLPGPPPSLDPLLALMADGMTGSVSTEPAAVAETHVSVVLFVGDRAYKVKKPADFGFLDFRTREAREAVCRREVELNRRLAPDVYLGVVDLVGPDGTPFDHLVVMRRMPSGRRLSTLVTTGGDVGEELRTIAQVLADFHARADVSAEIAEAGSVHNMRRNWETNSDQLRSFAVPTPGGPPLLDPGTVEAVAVLAERYLAGRTPLFDRRSTEGRIRDGHGDVLADDIFCLPDGPRILDCIEFDDRLRHGDVLGDVAFLAMDLERLGAPRLGAELLSRYRELTNETYPTTLEDFWIAYRAQVRTKVACLRAEQGDGTAAVEARHLLAMTLAHLKRCQVNLVLIGGAPGTGKSTLAKALAARQGWVLVRSDEVRKALFGLTPTSRSGAQNGIGEGIYDQASTAATYDEMLAGARKDLEQGHSVVLDASWADPRFRAAAAALASDTSCDLVELRCEAPMEVTLARIEARAARGDDPSDATAEVAQMLRASSPPWSTATVIDTGGGRDDSMAQVWAALGPEILRAEPDET